MPDVLRNLTLDLGPDPDDWTNDDRRAAVIELYRTDERVERFPSWIIDALADLSAQQHQALIEGLEHDSPAMRQAAVGAIVCEKLLTYPLASLGAVARDNEADWRAQRRSEEIAEEAERRYDAHREWA